jgi:uncharacterized alpha-E superfamily protein
MLSRVANSLYWMSRYIERAENMTRVLAVNFYTLLDARQIDSESGWRPLISMTGDEPGFDRHYDSYNAANVIDFVLWNRANASAVVWCVSLARENARSVREQISKEMWEYLNRLYFTVKEANHKAISRAPLEFYGQIRDASHAFQGITNETMTHGEAYQFIQLAKHLERADKTARILGFHHHVSKLSSDDVDDDPLRLMAMLKSCSAFEPFRKTYASRMRTASAIEYLLVDQEFPRAVAYCLSRSLRSVSLISGVDEAAKRLQALSNPQRSLGRLVSELEYLDVGEVLGDSLFAYLGDLVVRITRAGDDVASTYFNTQVIMPELHPQQAQQQQQ